jgi:hypothetical protein
MSQTITKAIQTDYTRDETDLHAHIEDACTVNSIRNGKLVAVRWNDLTEEERRCANLVTFHLCDWEGVSA